MNKTLVKSLIKKALREDQAANDKTTLYAIEKSLTGRAAIFASEPGILCGIDIAKQVFKEVDSKLKVHLLLSDKGGFTRQEKILIVSGRLQSILKAERVALNFLSLLSGIATTTAFFAEKAKKNKVLIKDTRKTTPGLRELEKYAVRTGGGKNHRMDLSKGIMLKDNHLRAAGIIDSGGKINKLKLNQLWRKLRSQTRLPVIVETESFLEFKEVIKLGPEVIILDNFSYSAIAKAVAYRNANFPKTKLEASGRVTLKTIAAISLTGVDSVSIGSITHSPKALDFSLEIL